MINLEMGPQESEVGEKSEKEKQWEEVEEELEKVAGFDIELEIKEPVIALNASGINTTNSCEGHYNHGRIVPWISIGVYNQPEERYVGQKEFEQEIFNAKKLQDIYESWLKYLKEFAIARDEMIRTRLSKDKPLFDEKDSDEFREIDLRLMEENKIYPEDIEQIMSVLRKMPEEIENAAKQGILKEETGEYKKWDEQNQKILNKAGELLGEFYQNRNIPENVRLILYDGPFGHFLRNEGGEDYVELDKKMTKKEKRDYEDIINERISKKKQEELKARIELYRTEFKEFAEFLKEKFFSE